MDKKFAVVSGFGFAMQLGATMDEIRRTLGVSEEEFHVLGTPKGRPHLERMIAGLKHPAAGVPKSEIFLQRCFAAEKIVLGWNKGEEIIARAGRIFVRGIDSIFTDRQFKAPSQKTPATTLKVYELIRGGTFMDVYKSLDCPLEQACLTQAQIIMFCKEHWDKLCGCGYGTFFLFRAGDDFFVACIEKDLDDRLGVHARSVSFDTIWDASSRHRFVVPQLES